MDIESLVRPNIRALAPYRSARQDHLSGILLDANENAFGSVVQIDGVSLHRYPDPFQAKLRTRLSALTGVPVAGIFTGVGSDEVIDLLMRVFCEPRVDRVLLLEPTYGMYRVAANIQDAVIDSCLLDAAFQIDVPAVLRAVTPNTKLIFCCSPNNPTGQLLRREDILALCRSTNAIVVVDEAYVDFAPAGSVADLIAATPNLVVMRTLSKAWGMAGIRLGYCLANPLIISYLMKVKSPYNINALTSRAACDALEREAAARSVVAAIIAERTRLAEALALLPFVLTVFPSDANFLLVRVTDASGIQKFLAERGLIIRNRSNEPNLANCLRITVGTPDENTALVAALRDYPSR